MTKNLKLIAMLSPKPTDLSSVQHLIATEEGETVDDVIDALAHARILHLDGDDDKNPLLTLTMDGDQTLRNVCLEKRNEIVSG